MDPIARIETRYGDTNSQFDIIMEYVVQIRDIQKTLHEHTKRFERLENKLDNHTHEAIVLRAK